GAMLSRPAPTNRVHRMRVKGLESMPAIQESAMDRRHAFEALLWFRMILISRDWPRKHGTQRLELWNEFLCQDTRRNDKTKSGKRPFFQRFGFDSRYCLVG